MFEIAQRQHVIPAIIGQLEIAIEQSGLRIIAETGVTYNLFADRWQLSSDTDVNYMVVAEKAA